MTGRRADDGVVGRAPGRDRAVSQTVAFVLVFSLIVTSVGLVTTAGVDSLQDVQQGQQAESSASLMRAVGAGVNAVANGDRPSYRSSIALAGGALEVRNETTVDVTVTNATGTPFSRTYRPGSVAYRADERNVTYQSGVLARGGERREAVLLAGAGFRCDEARDYAIVFLVRLRAPGSSLVGGASATIRATDPTPSPPGTRTGLAFPDTRPHPVSDEVSVTVNGPYRPAWVEALTERGFADAGGGTMTCDASRVFVSSPRVVVRLS